MTQTQPSVVLVHGAFADASSYAAVIPELLGDGLAVLAPAVPMRSLASADHTINPDVERFG